MPATIRDIKNATGLSLATISKYLNGGNVLPQNREKIEKAIEQLHYEVNPMARALVTKRSGLVGVIVYNISCAFAGTMLHYIGQELRKHNYGMLICDSCNDEGVEKQNLKFLLNRNVEGILVMPVSRHSGFLKPAKRAGVPVALIDRDFVEDGYDCVRLDNRAAGRRAVEYLIRNHHEKIAVIGSEEVYSGSERIKGYMQAMQEAGLTVPDAYRVTGKHSFELGYDGMKQLLALSDRPTAVFLCNYETTLGGVLAVNDAGITCPDDISLFGFDNLIMSDVLVPKIWAITQPMEAMSIKAVSLLWGRMQKTETSTPLTISFAGEVQKGGSVRML